MRQRRCAPQHHSINHNLTFNTPGNRSDRSDHAYRRSSYHPNTNAPPTISNNKPGFKPLPPQPSHPFLSLLRSPLTTPTPPCDKAPSKPPLPSILLPSLMSTTNTNTNSWTGDTNKVTANPPSNHRVPLPMSSGSMSIMRCHTPEKTQIRKRNAAEMMSDECPSQMLICEQGKKAKRQKTEGQTVVKHQAKRPVIRHKTEPKRQVIRQKTVKKTSHGKKMRVAIAQLKDFAKQHNGRLPSLRYVMKLLKVGFPKAHEIMEAFAREIGKSKNQVIQDMTIRQEKDRTTNNDDPSKEREHKTPPTQFKTQSRCSTPCSSASPSVKGMVPKKETTKSNMSINCNEMSMRSMSAQPASATRRHASRVRTLPKDFSKRLAVLVTAVAEDQTWDIFEKQYLWNLNKLEVFLDEFVTDSSLISCNLGDKVHIASAYYILGEMYYSRYHKLHVGYEYNQRALEFFKECNAMSSSRNGSCMTDLKEYLGKFWREFLEIFMLRGNMLLDSEDWKGAQQNYELSYNLVQRLSTKDIEPKKKFLRRSLEKLTIIHCYQGQYALSAKYGKQFYSELMKNDQAVPDRIGIKNIIESKAWLSCTLMLSSAQGDYAQGFEYYKEILNECQHKIDPGDPFIYRWFCYFAVHFIRTKAWNEAHELMEQILSIDAADVDDSLKNDLHNVFKVYVECLLGLDQYCGLREKVNHVMLVLHEKHMNVVNEINIGAKLQQKEYKTRNERLKRQTTNNAQDDDDYNEDIDMILMDKFNYNVHDMYNSLYPKINLARVLINQITLLLRMGNVHAAHQILYSVVIPESNCLNTTSKYWEHYPIDKVNQKEINALLSLL
eukprot:89316_1